LDENGLINREEFFNIKTRMLEYSIQTIKMYDYLAAATEPLGVFDKFNNMNTITNEYCKKITGWSKEEFEIFSGYINSIYDTQGRSKEFLIALYRYWLRKGTDQETLVLLEPNSSQQEISSYLDQIRKAITNDFVPSFLGANKGRKFFCAHKNESATELHQLNSTDLTLSADGTYCRIEKSANNQFQYDGYSGQKKQSIIKPFLISTVTGWIVDCYGPFKALDNDAKILDFILLRDKNLQNIIMPSKTIKNTGRTIFFLDRGNFNITFNILNFLSSFGYCAWLAVLVDFTST
jgi:hypothetical protein